MKERRFRHEAGFYIARGVVSVIAVTVLTAAYVWYGKVPEDYDKIAKAAVYGGLIPFLWSVMSLLIGLIPPGKEKRQYHWVDLSTTEITDGRTQEEVMAELRERYRPSVKAGGGWKPFVNWPRDPERIWWNEEKVRQYSEKYPGLKYGNEFGNIFLDTVWFVDGDGQEKEVEEWTREIERRGGFVRTDISGMLTHTLLTPYYDRTGYNQRASVRYMSSIVGIDEFRDIIEIAECTRKHNEHLFSPVALFDAHQKALMEAEEEDALKYVFMYGYGNGVQFIWLDEEGSKKEVKWAGEDTAGFWKEYGELISKSVIVSPRADRTVLAVLADKLDAEGISVPSFVYIDLVFYCHATLKHFSCSELEDMKNMPALIGQNRPENEEEMAYAVAAVFTALLIDYEKRPKEYLGYLHPSIYSVPLGAE